MKEKRRDFDLFRYVRVSFFFFRVALHLLFWDVLVNRDGLRWLRPNPLPRWRKLARRFKKIAVANGGVLIKLGQFLSIRVDILPKEVTRELAGLQDKLPETPYPEIVRILERDLGRRLGEVFREFEKHPMGSASLAQAHHAVLLDGTAVVVKVQHAGIKRLVETDLASFDLVCRWLRWYRPVALRVDLDWLSREFKSITRAELDFKAEASNLETFQNHFAKDDSVYMPHLYKEASGSQVLTMENVAFIKITDLAELERVGILANKVADAFFDIHMEQIFGQNLVHADPHPGNLFVEPLPTKAERAAGKERYLPGEAVPHAVDRPFRVVIIDFGMVAEIPKRLRHALREFAFGIAKRNPHQIVQAYVHAGTLLPGVDLQRLEEVHEVLLEHIWGVSMNRISDAAGDAFNTLIDEYRDMIFETPFQVQVDLLFVVRSVEILNGILTSLEPSFNLFHALIPQARKMATADEGLKNLGKDALSYVKSLVDLPKRADDVLAQMERGALVVRNAVTPELRRRLLGMETAINRGRHTLTASVLFLGGILVYLSDKETWLDETLLSLSVLMWLKSLVSR